MESGSCVHSVRRWAGRSGREGGGGRREMVEYGGVGGG